MIDVAILMLLIISWTTVLAILKRKLCGCYRVRERPYLEESTEC